MSAGCVSKFCAPSGSTTQGCLLRVQKCTVGRGHEVSSRVPARTFRTVEPGLGPGEIRRPAFRTYPAGCHTSAVSCALDYARLPRNKAKSVSLKHDRHRERAAGHALAVRAVTGVDHVGRLGDLVAERSALATTGASSDQTSSVRLGYSPIGSRRYRSTLRPASGSVEIGAAGRRMTAVEAWASKAGQIGDGSSPPDPAFSTV